MPAMTQQKLAQSLSSSVLISLGGFTSTNQMAQGFVRGMGNPYGRQIAGPIAAGQLQGVASIRFHPITRLHRHQRRRNHFALHGEGGQLPVQHVAGGSRFVADAQAFRRSEAGLPAAGRNRDGWG
jgi:hypothetical protein